MRKQPYPAVCYTSVLNHLEGFACFPSHLLVRKWDSLVAKLSQQKGLVLPYPLRYLPCFRMSSVLNLRV